MNYIGIDHGPFMTVRNGKPVVVMHSAVMVRTERSVIKVIRLAWWKTAVGKWGLAVDEGIHKSTPQHTTYATREHLRAAISAVSGGVIKI